MRFDVCVRKLAVFLFCVCVWIVIFVLWNKRGRESLRADRDVRVSPNAIFLSHGFTSSYQAESDQSSAVAWTREIICRDAFKSNWCWNNEILSAVVLVGSRSNRNVTQTVWPLQQVSSKRGKCVFVRLRLRKWADLSLSYLSCLSVKVDILPCGNLPLISVQVGWKELEREVGTCSYKGLEKEGERGRGQD